MTDAKAHDDVEAVVRAAIEGMDGVEIEQVVVRSTPRGGWSVQVCLFGWGPGLHRMHMQWNVPDTGPYVASTMPFVGMWRRRRLVRRLRRELGGHVERQQLRALRGLLIGAVEPLPLPSAADAATVPGAIRIDHLLVDRMALVRLVEAISASSGTDGAERALLDRQLAFDAASAYETDLQAPTVHAGESVLDDGVLVRGLNVVRKLPVAMREIAIGGAMETILQAYFGYGRKAIYDGSHLVVAQMLPETVLQICAGRRLGDVVATGTPIDDRIVVTARNIGSTTVLETDVDPVRLSDLPAVVVTLDEVLAMPRVAAVAS